MESTKSTKADEIRILSFKLAVLSCEYSQLGQDSTPDMFVHNTKIVKHYRDSILELVGVSHENT